MILILLKSNLIFKVIQVLLMSGIKFIFAPPFSIESGLTYFQTIAATTAGGIAGIFFFYYLSGGIIRLYRMFVPKLKSMLVEPNARNYQVTTRTKQKKYFTWKNKLIIKIRNKYGMYGIILLTPVLLSIPIGAFLANKYYSKNKNVLLYLSASVIFWSLSISTIYFFTF